jgi:prepilin-type N-terminal cleavage/methylation domain-containing protein
MQKGFTLIELMVSVAIFSIVMVIALGALLSISSADRKSETIASVMHNLNFALESMTRTIRTGYDYHCGSDVGGDCTSGDDYFKFTGPSGTDVIYRFDNTALCGQTGATVGCIVRSVDGGAFAPITAPEVIITNVSSGNSGLTFYLRGSDLGSTGDNVQPNVVITVTGYVQVTELQRTQFSLQTSATQRLYDR